MAKHKVRTLLSACAVLLCGTSVVMGAPASLDLDDVPAKEIQQNFLRDQLLSPSEGSRGLGKIISSDAISIGRGEDCKVYRKDGTVDTGACYSSDKGPENVWEYRVPLTAHNMVANQMEDEHYANNVIGRVLTTYVGNAIAAFSFGQPAAGQILEIALNNAHHEAELCQSTHYQHLADLLNGPGGDAEAKAYLGCIRKHIDPALGSDTAPPCQAIAACQNDDYLSHEARGKPGTNVLPAVLFVSDYSTGFKPKDNECHPRNPRLNWVDPYDTASNTLKEARLLFTDLLFCEYHKTCTPHTINTTRGNTGKSDEEKVCDTGLGYEQFLRQYVGNFALMDWTTGTNPGIFPKEWQSVAPYTLPWPPNGGAQKPAPEVYSLYRGGEVFTYLMQMMRNRCEFHNVMESAPRDESAIERIVTSGSPLSLTLHNGPTSETVTGDDMKEIREKGFCASQHEMVRSHRAALSQPGLLFDEATCDVMWYQAKKGFYQNTYSCDELTGCLDNTSGSCNYGFAQILQDAKNAPQWVLLMAAYSKVIGEMQWRAHLQGLDYHIKQMTRGKDSWYLKKAEELIQNRLTADLNNTIEVSKDALNKEIDRLIKEKNDNASSVLSNTKSSDNTSSGVNPGSAGA